MDFIEIIGFLISILALAFLFLRQVYLEWYRRKFPEEYAKGEKERERQMRALYKEMHFPVEEEKEVKKEKPKRSQKKEIRTSKQHQHEQFQSEHQQEQFHAESVSTQHESFTFDPNLETRHKKVKEMEAYRIKTFQTHSRGQEVLKKTSLKNLVILSEIYGDPKGKFWK